MPLTVPPSALSSPPTCTCEVCTTAREARLRPGYAFNRIMRLGFNAALAQHRQGRDRDSILAWVADRLAFARCTSCGDQEGSCGCWFCESCGEMHAEDVPRCNNCGNCHDSCNCNVCVECGRHVSDDRWCGDCDRCNDCCTCDEAPRRTPRGVFHGESSPRYPRFLGVEIEFGHDGRSTLEFQKACKKWQAGLHEDGSIEGFSYANEISLAPARGQAFLDQTTEVCAGIAKAKGKVNTSCGLHVHVDLRDFTGAEILNLARLYAKIEPALYSIVPPSRRTGHYSKPWGDAFEIGEVFDRAPREERLKRLDAALYGSLDEAEECKRAPYKHNNRYHGLNFNSILLYGTIEFRLHSGTVDAKKIQMWGAVCTAIVEFAKNHTERTIASLRGSAFDVLTSVLKEDKEILAWAKVRRAHFAGIERKRKGLVAEAPPREAAFGPLEESESESAEIY